MGLKRVLERHHQLDAFERAEPEFFDRRAGLQVRPPRVFRDERGESAVSGDRDRLRRAADDPVADRRALQLSCALGTRQAPPSGQTSARRMR